MNARIYASLFRWQDKVLFVLFAGFFTAMAFLHSIPKDPTDAEISLSLLLPPFVLSAFIVRIWNQPLQRPISALCPDLQKVLFRWNVGVVLAFATGWAAIMHRVQPALSLTSAIGIAGALCTLPLAFSVGQPAVPAKARLGMTLWAIIIGANLGSSSLRAVGPAFLAHSTWFGAAGFGLTAINLRLTQRRKSPAYSTQIRTAKETAGISDWLNSLFGRSSTDPDARPKSLTYRSRGTSLLRWVQAAADESPRGSIGAAGLMFSVVALHPLLFRQGGGYPMGWYDAVFSQAAAPLIVLVVVSIAFSLLPGLLRTDGLYPISRRQRAQVAFAASAQSFAFNYLVIAGGSVALAVAAAWYLKLPMPVQPLAEFLVRMAGVIPFMPLVRRAALYLEDSQNLFEILFLIGCVMGLMAFAQILLLNAGIEVGAVVCVVAIIVSQVAYYASLRRFYTKSDLIRRGTTTQLTLVEI